MTFKIFSNPEFGQVRTFEKDGEPWFVGKDVAKALGYSNPHDALAKHVREEEKNSVAIRDGTCGNPNVVVINESGLYSLVFASKLPTAQDFRYWVTSDVLPSIRKYGAYMTPDALEQAVLNPDYLVKIALALKDESDRRKQAEFESAEKSKVIEHKTDVITGLTEDVSLAEKRQRINQIVKFKASGTQYQARWKLLYSEFEKKYHINLNLRYKNNKKNFKPQLKSVVEYVDRGLNMIPELYDLTCKLFESDFNKLLEEWSSTIVLDNVVNGNFT